MEMNLFKEYLKEPKALAFETMEALHEELLQEIGNDPDAIELYEELVDAANTYAGMRAKWMLMSREEKMDKDPLRSSHHDSLITHFNMMQRYLRMQGFKAEWRDKLGYEADDKYFRKAIGDFGCYIVFVNSLCAR